jgi:hypothetical protein
MESELSLACTRRLRGDLDHFFGLCLRQRDPELTSARLWTWSRTTAWRRVKEIMAAGGITGTPAMPKGLRHGFGMHAFQASVPPHLVQRWLGHASPRPTAIYGDAVGPDERAFAARMWSSSRHELTGRDGRAGLWSWRRLASAVPSCMLISAIRGIASLRFHRSQRPHKRVVT